MLKKLVGHLSVFVKLVEDRYIDNMHKLDDIPTEYFGLHPLFKEDQPCSKPMTWLKWLTLDTYERVELVTNAKGWVCKIQ